MFTARRQTRAENMATQKGTFSLTAFELSCNRASSDVRLHRSSLVSGVLIFSASTLTSILHHFTLIIGFRFNYWIYQFPHIFSSFYFNNLRTHNSNVSLFSQPDLKQIALCTTVVLNV